LWRNAYCGGVLILKQEEIIQKYFAAWLNNDVNTIRHIMSDKIIYSECYGPEYHGINQVITWFMDWNHCGTVLKWDIKQFIHHNNVTAVEWYFECSYDNSISGFDGMSLIEFDDTGKILNIKEFQSKAEHYLPYDE
jgi:hypothetical protein